MIPEFKTRDVAKSLYVNYLKRAQECFDAANRIIRILRIKNMAEYEERLVYKSEAEKTLQDSERFFDFIKKKLP